jgi:hypothetical protein
MVHAGEILTLGVCVERKGVVCPGREISQLAESYSISNITYYLHGTNYRPSLHPIEQAGRSIACARLVWVGGGQYVFVEACTSKATANAEHHESGVCFHRRGSGFAWSLRAGRWDYRIRWGGRVSVALAEGVACSFASLWKNVSSRIFRREK